MERYLLTLLVIGLSLLAMWGYYKFARKPRIFNITSGARYVAGDIITIGGNEEGFQCEVIEVSSSKLDGYTQYQVKELFK